ncbi:putative RNA 2'-phosphotransferase [Pseudomonas chlororaphis]|uniref:RNA 2'-phosphotransferase n=1 Tax=Pseudomonas chlororaphis TaxID=587753 RepID=UPI00209EAA77|nr:RNA 2'-phosphotransferase [Pseudomonas chlororaphis]MCP1482186.1 putative RNA 2'-phosphotransferase [Pseudomonas chlororaphis]MCP1597455.1 putative RNA 2'-phosphotransferase [Pseudomonas chlororaphis]
MSRKAAEEVSKFLSYVLRHKPQAIGLQLDSEGWAEVEALIGGAAREGRQLTPELIAEVVASNDKKRFALSEDGQRIRAVQGHSSKTVSLQLAEQQPPAVLYHGTATRFMDSINEKGLIPGTRHHVHLSQDLATAEAVGQRYGKVVILKIAAQDMQAQGFKFYQAENGVWLTDHVPVDFLSPL